MTSFVATVEICPLHSSSPLARQQWAVSDQVQGYSESVVDTDVDALKLEMDASDVELERETGVSQEISKREQYLDD
jgi:hypothetical protein